MTFVCLFVCCFTFNCFTGIISWICWRWTFITTTAPYTQLSTRSPPHEYAQQTDYENFVEHNSFFFFLSFALHPKWLSARVSFLLFFCYCCCCVFLHWMNEHRWGKKTPAKLHTRFIINDVDRRLLMQRLLPINNRDLFPNQFPFILSRITFFLCTREQKVPYELNSSAHTHTHSFRWMIHVFVSNAIQSHVSNAKMFRWKCRGKKHSMRLHWEPYFVWMKKKRVFAHTLAALPLLMLKC